MARALLVANERLAAGGFVGDELEQRGYRFTVVAREHPGTWPQLDGAELVLVLGSDWHAHEPERQDTVIAESALLAAAHRRAMPVLGICYGAQLLSHSLGGTVRPADRIEVGWCEVESCTPVIRSGPWMQWHSDTFTVPGGAELLACSDVGPQAFRYGRSFAVQFHPEVDVEMVSAWISADAGVELAEAGIDADELLEQTRAETPRSETDARALVGWFCEQL